MSKPLRNAALQDSAAAAAAAATPAAAAAAAAAGAAAAAVAAALCYRRVSVSTLLGLRRAAASPLSA